MKARFRLGRNYLAGLMGDALNVMLAGAAWNLVKWMNGVLSCWALFLSSEIRQGLNPIVKAFSFHRVKTPKLQGTF
jgi:hypothetical protein